MSSSRYERDVSQLPPRDKSGEAALRSQAVGFLPGWDNREGQGALSALLDIAGHYNDLLDAAIQDAETKAQLVALDAMGTSLRDPSPASTVVVFNIEDSSRLDATIVPKGTIVAADISGRMISFETNDELNLITAPLDQVIEIRNGELMDITFNSKDKRFAPVQSIYIRVNYAVFGGTCAEIELSYGKNVPDLSNWRWQLWSENWMDLKVDQCEIDEDGRCIRVKLTNANPNRSLPQVLKGVVGHWIRLVETPPENMRQTPVSAVTIERVCITTNLPRNASVPLEHIFVNQQKADPTLAIAPFGESPRPGASIAIACGDVFGRAAESISFHFERVIDGANASDVGDNDTPKATKIIRKASALTKVGLNPLALMAALHEFAKEALPFYALVCRVLFELFDFALEASKWIFQSLFEQSKNLLRWIGVSDPELIPSKNTSRMKQENSEEKSNTNSPLTVGPKTVLELWNGKTWTEVATSQNVPSLTMDGTLRQPVTFSLKDGGARLSELYGQAPSYWMRIRLVSGVFGDWLNVPQTEIEGKGQARFLLSKPPRISAPLITFEHTDDYGQGSATGTPVSAFAVTEYRWASVTPNVIVDKEFVAERHSCHASRTLERLVLPDGYYLGFDGPLSDGRMGIFAATLQSEADGLSSSVEKNQIIVQYCFAPNYRPSDEPISTAYARESVPEFKPSENNSSSNFGSALGTLITFELKDIKNPPVIPVKVIARNRVQTFTPNFAAGGQLLNDLERYEAGSECVLRDEEGAVEVKIQQREKDRFKLAEDLHRNVGPATLEPLRPELFGVRRSWIRLLKFSAKVERFDANAISVTQAETHHDEVLGNSNGQPSQAFRARFLPILEGECLEVQELAGKRAEIEYELLKSDVQRANEDNDEGLIRVVRNPGSGRIEEVWVQWQRKNSLLQSNSQHRHYVIDQQRGLIMFGDGHHGRIPPNSSLIVLRSYRHGGGRDGNVGPNGIQQVLSPGFSDISVSNPIRSEGGNDGDTLEESWDKDKVVRSEVGPSRIERFLRQNTLFRSGSPLGIQAADFETIARRSTSAIADAIMLPPTKTNPGEPICSTMIILPFDYKSGIRELLRVPEPESPPEYVQLPSVLVNKVMESIGQSASPWVVNRLKVRGPEIVRLNVTIKTLEVLSSADSSELRKRTLDWMRNEYFDAVSGGPSAWGWLSKELRADIETELIYQLHQLDSRITDCTIQGYRDTVAAGESAGRRKIELSAGQIPFIQNVEIELISDPVRSSTSGIREVRQK